MDTFLNKYHSNISKEIKGYILCRLKFVLKIVCLIVQI